MKTSIELQITPEEYAALIETRDYLRGPGRDTFVPEHERWDEEDTRLETEHLAFNMGMTCEPYTCGTVACIGGTASLFMQGAEVRPHMFVDGQQAAQADEYVRSLFVNHDCSSTMNIDLIGTKSYAQSSGLARLYYPRPLKFWEQITPEIAAQAVDNYLNTGDPCWEDLARQHGFERAKSED